MKQRIRTALVLARDVLWELLVRHARGDLDLGECRQWVDQAHLVVEDVVGSGDAVPPVDDQSG